MVRREPSSQPGGTTWTGLGFMQSFEGSTLKFLIPDIFR